ncbi:MBL fold metallo-hydrolase [Stenotrophomonas rhizophila]|uniref:MBL fold metallo-hydrolase n=1 Tax=Stenotrophomonas rhizophila TaxID=216778 RepID=UPI001E43946E|nr:MBL fold metallo-hydrolase [Stenotrophomonas rhizophila]MCC7635368.1 MBL fold metallo-hydrolase [Stenotrophomonas rhizophila]MCC7664403.1 MBL fold metallo-hydrolase [Stenotrophomonas rhizophila]
MHLQPLGPDVLLCVGEDYQSVATVFLDGNDALLVDSMGSAADADRLRALICEELGKAVRVIVSTHFMSDHIAGLATFPDAMVIAHRNYRHTFLSQNRRVDGFYREPQVVFDSAMRIRWGRHALGLLHNPGRTIDHISVDVPSADLACVGDNIVGNIVYLSNSDPVQMRAAIDRVKQVGRGTVVGGHMGRFGAAVLDNALHYLDRICRNVVAIRAQAEGESLRSRLAAIRIEDCLAPGVEASAFEREWHLRNLEAIEAQGIFGLDTYLARSADVA